jgi:sugar phosphate isomerase/epimerase
MTLGISSFTYGWAVGMDPYNPKLGELDLLKRVEEYGLKCLQVGDNLPLHRLTELRLKEFQTTLEKNHTRLEVGARKLTEDHLQRYLEISIFLKAPLLRFVVDGDDYQPSNQTIISIVKNILPELKKNDITLGIENHDRFKARELVAIMDAIADEHIGICLDTVNSIGAGEGLEWVADLLAPYTVNLHIKDFQIQRFHHNMGFNVTGAPAGTGMMEVPWLIAKLLPFGRCKSAILEQWATPEATTELTIEKEMSWADVGIKYLKSLSYFTTN